MDYREIAPAPTLRAHVRCYWFLRDDAPNNAAEPILPDGSVEWIFHLGDPFLALEGETPRRQAAALCVHDLERPMSLVPGPVVDVVGIRFRPGRAYPFLRLPAAQLSGRSWDLGDLGAVHPLVRERLYELVNDESRAAWLDSLLTTMLADARVVDRRFDDLTAFIDRANGAVAVERLAELRGVSRRQLERLFLDRVGMGPKRFSRLLRFRKVVRDIRSSPRAWLDRSMEAGYFDQSHLIREFREFAGVPPGELAHRLLPMNDLFVSEAMSHSSNPAPVSLVQDSSRRK